MIVMMFCTRPQIRNGHAHIRHRRTTKILIIYDTHVAATGRNQTLHYSNPFLTSFLSSRCCISRTWFVLTPIFQL